ncbi:hypothetical protein [Polyangium sp. y55x31]|uniref:hypothetical protein n=1 Tax=Polyangium sp. y55x31 TaxID=3042688 RepID=UPI002482C70E|nr:hypothetical protein [Polyangium sp. y55x31]MDI1481889.1 hypothetical protein [Polyangium sp. y55x31]
MAQRNGIFGAALVFLLACSAGDEAGGSSGEFQGAGGMGTAVGSTVGSGTGSGGEGGAGGDASTMPTGSCDDLASCGDYSRGCTGCAVKGPCAPAYEGCFGDKSCVEFNMCMAGCESDVACQNGCAMGNPLGAERYNALVTCILCESCPISCADTASICP